MGNPTMKQILADTQKLVGQKMASIKAAEITGQAPSSMPGSEHDSATPASAKQPDKETRDGTMVPNSGLSAAGAGDDSPLTRGQALEADEAALEPTKKPAITADANAKTADNVAVLANEILASIRGVQKSAAAPAPAVVTPPATVAKAPAPAVAAPSAASAPAKVAEEQLNMLLTTDVLAKLAAVILSTDEGAAVAASIMEKAAGAEAAQETMAFIARQAALAEKQAAHDQGVADADRAIDEQLFLAGVKYAQDMMGADPQAAAAAMGMGADPAAGGADPMAGGEGGADPAAGGADPMAGGEGDGVTEEQLLATLQEMIESGEITPEEIQKLLAESGGKGDEGGEAVPAEEPPASDADAAAGADPALQTNEGEEKTSAANILAAIRQLQQARASK